jgi:hypothetical protein
MSRSSSQEKFSGPQALLMTSLVNRSEAWLSVPCNLLAQSPGLGCLSQDRRPSLQPFVKVDKFVLGQAQSRNDT